MYRFAYIAPCTLGYRRFSYAHHNQDSPKPIFICRPFHDILDKTNCQKYIPGKHVQNRRFKDNHHEKKSTTSKLGIPVTQILINTDEQINV